MTRLAYKLEEKAGARQAKRVATTLDKAVERQDHGRRQARPGRSGAFSAGFYAGIVLACDVLAILLSGIVIHGLYTGDFAHDFGRHLVGVTLFAVLATLVLNSAGLYR